LVLGQCFKIPLFNFWSLFMMKKTLVALAAAAATGAFAQVTISGNIDIGVRNTDAQAVSSKSVEMKTNNVSTSTYGFAGTEDLGGGLKAGFKLEGTVNVGSLSSLGNNNITSTSAAAADTTYWSGTPFDSEQFLSLSGDFGTVRAGVPNSAMFRAQGTSQPFGTGLGSGYSGEFSRLGFLGGYGISNHMGLSNGTSTSLRVQRMAKTIQYETPVMNGLSVMGEYAFGNDNVTSVSASNSPTWMGLLVNYSAGPLNVSASYNKYSNGTNDIAGNRSGVSNTLVTNLIANNADISYTFLGANYTVGQNTFYAGMTNVRSSTADEDSQSWNIAYKYAVNDKADISANMVSKTSSVVPTSAPATNNLNAKLIALGADYRLSKRTSLYARYENTDTNTDNVNSGEIVRTAVGIRHQF